MISIRVDSGNSFPLEVSLGFILFFSLSALKDWRDRGYDCS